MLSTWYLEFLYFILGVYFISVFRYHFMIVLLGFEFFMLSLFYFICGSDFNGLGGYDILIIFLVMMVVEGAFGLSVLIYYTFLSGGDYFYYTSFF